MLHSEELHNLYSSSNIIKVIKSSIVRWVDLVACMGMRYVYKILVGKPEGKRSLRRPRHGSEDNIIVDLKICWEGVNWMQLAQDRDQWQILVNTVMSLWVHKRQRFSSIAE
jgi:hypothetical protein